MAEVLYPSQVERQVEERMTSLKHFLRLARQGRHRGSSGGEKACARLAQLIVDEVPGLDGQAVAGLVDLIKFAQAKPASARELVEWPPPKKRMVPLITAFDTNRDGTQRLPRQ